MDCNSLDIDSAVTFNWSEHGEREMSNWCDNHIAECVMVEGNRISDSAQPYSVDWRLFRSNKTHLLASLLHSTNLLFLRGASIDIPATFRLSFAQNMVKHSIMDIFLGHWRYLDRLSENSIARSDIFVIVHFWSYWNLSAITRKQFRQKSLFPQREKETT